MSTVNHNSDDREVTNCLIDLSEVVEYVNENKTKASKTPQSISDWADAVVGWRKTFEFPRKSTNTVTGIGNVKKKRTVERSVTDLHYGSAYYNQNQGDDYWSNSSTISEYKPSVRCIGDDFETFPIPPWKSNIEQGTCRYVHDNGSYRTLKFMYDDRKDWYTMRKKRPEKVSATWHHTCKRMQREMKRQLKKDLAVAEREREKNTGSKSDRSSARQSVEPSSGEETQTSTSRIPSEAERHTPQMLDLCVGSENQMKRKEAQSQGLRPISYEYNVKTINRKEHRVKSTHSDGAVNQARKMKTIHESEPVTPVPHYSIPSGSQMLKSASDLFIENFSSKISALEDEIKRDSKWLRKNENELSKLQSNRAKYRDATRSIKENGSSSVTPRGPIRTEPLTSDIFSVKPMAHKEVKPLENIKSNTSKSSNIGQNGDQLHDTYGSTPNSNNCNAYTNGFTYHSEMDRGLNGYKANDDSSKYTLFNTLTGTKINTQNNKKTSKGFSTPSTITICDNSPAGSTSHHFNEKTADAFRQIPVMPEKKSEKRGTLQNIPALLPEISGKRLEPASISHRLL